MKVILIQDVPSIGKAWEVHNVSEGYARNMLFPRKLAIEANAGNMKELDKRRASAEAKEAKIVAEAQDVAKKIEALGSVKITGKVAEGATKLYGSITSSDIAEALAAKGITVDKRKIELSEPIKALGEYEAPIHLHRKVATRIKVEVVEG